jgi:hypothetical protein
MSFILEIAERQAIALMGLAERDTNGVPSYSTLLGDTSYASEEITRAAQNGVTEIMKTICETDGHPHKYLFTDSTALTHGTALPPHFGSIGEPRITPYAGASYTIVGKRKSIEEINSYRANVNSRYSPIAHNASSGGNHSKLAGFYAVDEAIQTIYFTGYSAVSDITNFQESDYELLPDIYYPLGTALCITHLKKDGDVSDIFNYYAEIAASGLRMIRNNESDQPSLKKTVGTRDAGTK